MGKILFLLHKVAEFGTIIGFMGMILAVSIQVFARFFLPSAPSWTEELSRIFFIYTVAFGVSIGVREQAFVRLEFLKNYVPEKFSRNLDIIIQYVVVLFSVVLIYFSYHFIILGINEKSPSLKISMSFVFASILIMMVSIAVFSFEQLIELKKSKNK